MATLLTSSSDTPFTPTQELFRVQANGKARLLSRGTSAVDWAPVLDENRQPVIVDGVLELTNNTSGVQYKLEAVLQGTTVAAYE